MGIKRAKLLLAKVRDDEVLIEEIISKERIQDEIIGFHAQQAGREFGMQVPSNLKHRNATIDIVSDLRGRRILRVNSAQTNLLTMSTEAKTIKTEIELSNDVLYSQGVYKNHYSVRELEEDIETAKMLGIVY